MSGGGQVEEQAWWMKYGARGVGCGGGIIAIGLGAFACFTITPVCLIAGIWQMFSGFIVVSAEAPCCCMFIDFVDKYSKWVDLRPSWQKASLYIGISLPPIFLCFGLATFFGSAMIFLCGALYGMMAIGKKASRSDMMTSATIAQPSFSMKTTLVDSEAPPSTFK